METSRIYSTQCGAGIILFQVGPDEKSLVQLGNRTQVFVVINNIAMGAIAIKMGLLENAISNVRLSNIFITTEPRVTEVI